jgi:signal transduction histidine kinase/ligand-binding sensor domain-containing protein
MHIVLISKTILAGTIFSLCLSVGSPLQAQTQYINFRHYSLADGLSSYKVVKVLQDRFGFIWIATQDGLNRFDGKDIIIYNKSAREKHLLLGSDITGMLEDTVRNILWVITPYGGLHGINLSTGAVQYTVAIADTANRFSHPWLKSIAQRKNELWIGTYDGITVYNIEENKWKNPVKFPFKKDAKKNYEFDIHYLHVDEYNRVWAFVANYGLVLFPEKDFSAAFHYPLPELLVPAGYLFKRINSCQNTEPGKLLVGTHTGAREIIYDASGIITVKNNVLPEAERMDIRQLHQDAEHNLWFATGEGLFRKNTKDGITYMVDDVNKADQKKWTSSVNAIFFDNHNYLWLGTLQGAAIATRLQSPFQNYYQSVDLKTKIERSSFVFPYNDSVEFVCAYEGFYRVDNLKKEIRRLKEDGSWFMFRHKDGKMIVCMNGRIYHFSLPNQFTEIEKVYPELAPISHQSFNSAVYWNDSLLFWGSEESKGVYEWNYKKRKLIKTDSLSSALLKDGIVNFIYKDQRNRIWILSDNSFAIYNPANRQLENHELVHPVTGQILNLYFDVCEANGYYWLASYGSGIIQLDEKLSIKKIISTNDGMANAGIYKVFPLNDSLLLSTSNNGLSKINTHNYSVSNYFESDGLHSNAFEELCGTLYNGKIYAGGPDGFTIIDPKFITPNTTPPELYINNIVIESKKGRQEITDLFLQTAKLPRNLLQATVWFSALNFSSPELTTYAYRIKEQQDEWVQLGNQNFVTLIGLAPGTYTLQVKAKNEDGYESSVKEIQIILLPRWYQTTWFKILVALLALGITYGLYRVRINQLKKEKEIRSHLASDLHDDLGSTLNSVKVYASMAMTEKENNGYLEKIKESTQEAISGVRDIIWVLDDKKDLLDHLLTRINTFAVPLCEAHHIAFNRRVNDALLDSKLGKEEKRNLYMIIKEAINNSIKYSDAADINLFIEKKDNKLLIGITDNGRGFEQAKITEGNGLKNIMRRSADIGYRASVISSPGNGTSLLLEKK